ncbi:MAG: bifunctional methylenetetrahydrofolate dehydrogenase/methenyltetrahydrofolate cyclohydrolase [Clostridium sp.]|uniref:bifunctional methylenetetrahydrofolate dehydrogenase/methenyltetrahydrofolate cyclohydrolase n=1 Tax=Clostridium sp. DSM 8431 TaxID=1761781 RepID=UPI0008E59EEB|nr:bifunctional methylenetetrahydrofolate dehydrogenase/methenyltetrahydrofolate cyclohydrolase [Clostridium sp. DSM 8431]MCR4944045.1 bifunctional methylenetetrahydrofolate dehydrogenase/methenyltetrahydrofolate cyclohydrolase [Clostridium sp.]SFU55913.1 methylenetetrahydrofolate dehydrogenase (NADP+) / methenyltetrahydrofolate cyclohydrolase [Clostridium sp. DSM 8431]
MGQIINGREIAKAVKEEIHNFVQERVKNNKSVPKIASILVGNDGGSIYYMNNQEKVATSLGLLFEKIILNEVTTEEELIKLIERLNKDESVSGIILQLPLPKHINEKKVVNYIDESKDIDCLSIKSQGKLYMGDEGFIPCTPNSVVTLLKMLNINLSGKEAVVVGRSNIVGKPAAQLLLNENCTVTICHSRTKNLQEVCKRADILVAAIGKPKFINENFIKEGAIVIDVGTSSVDGKICGDVDFEKVIEKASFVTPVPGGVGALTTTLLIKNACEALKKNEN